MPQLLLQSEKASLTLPGVAPSGRSPVRDVPRRTYRYIDRNGQKTAEFPLDSNDDISGVIASASSGPLQDYQDKLKVIQLRERGLSKTDIAAKVGRSEYWVKRWWREYPATLERPAGANDVVMKKASLHSFRDLEIRRGFHDDSSIYDLLVQHVKWRQCKVVARDPNTGELGLRFDKQGRSIDAGRQVADYTGGLGFLDLLLQKVFSTMGIRDPQSRIFMNYYANGHEKTGVHRHDFWTCLLSFGEPRILTVDNRPILLRNSDLIVFGLQNHGVPVMPESTGGRISLVIFFYPDADNLERQWQTITEEGDDEEKVTVKLAEGFRGGIDMKFDAAMLSGNNGFSNIVADPCSCSEVSGIPKDEESALRQAFGRDAARNPLFKSPNAKLSFGTSLSPARTSSFVIFSIACCEAAGDALVSEKEFFEQLKPHDVQSLWDFRTRPLSGSWCEPDSFRSICKRRFVKYRAYPLGRREAGGPTGHVSSEEGRDILKRFLQIAGEERPVAYLVSGDESAHSGDLCAAIADCLVSGQLGHRVRVSHIRSGKLEEHPQVSSMQCSSVAGASQCIATHQGIGTVVSPRFSETKIVSSAAAPASSGSVQVADCVRADVSMVDMAAAPAEGGSELSNHCVVAERRTNRWARRHRVE